MSNQCERYKMRTNKMMIIFVCLMVMIIFSGCTSSKKDTNPETTKKEVDASQNQVNINNKDNLIGVIDCGISRTSAESELMPLDEMGYESDLAMVCIGKNVLNNCKKAKAIVDSKKGTLVSYEIIGLKGQDCVIRLGDAGGTAPMEEEKFLEGTSMECPVDIEDLQAGDKRDYSTMPGLFAAELHLLLSFELLNEDTKCTGTMIDAMNAERAKEAT